MATSRKLLKEEIVSVGSSVVRLNTLVAGAAFAAGLCRLTVHNLDAAVNLQILQASSQPSSGSMDILVPDGSKAMEWELKTCNDVWVYAASTIKVCVIQEGP